jgi:hypothetical protein
MSRRILILSAIVVLLAVGAILTVRARSSEAWDARRAVLEEMAIHPPASKRPWEVRFDALQARLRGATRFDEIARSSHHPSAAWSVEEPRPFNDLERIWTEAIWNELSGLDSILESVRRLSEGDAKGSGALKSWLMVSRDFTNALCARAWLAVESGDRVRALQDWRDALLLARATDEGTSMGAFVRIASEGIVLRSIRSALRLGVSAVDVSNVLTPLLEGLAFDPERAERAIRRDLSFLESAVEDNDLAGGGPNFALAFFKGVESALETARGDIQDSPWAAMERDTLADNHWDFATQAMHSMHSHANVALTALAVAAHRDKHGAFPASLAEVEDLPAEHSYDPLRGAPLPYTLTEDGARIGPAAWVERVQPGRDPDSTLFVWTLRK